MFNRVQSTQDEMACFIKGNELKSTQVELFPFLIFKRVEFKKNRLECHRTFSYRYTIDN